MSAASSKLGRPECGSSRALPGDLRTVFGEIFGFTCADGVTAVEGTVKAINVFFRGFNLSDRDIVHKIGCSMYQAVHNGDYVNDRNFVYDLDAFMRAGNAKQKYLHIWIPPSSFLKILCLILWFHEACVDTPTIDFRTPDDLNKCPDDCKSQLEALVSAAKRNFESTVQFLGYVVALPEGATEGAVQGGNGILKKLSKGCSNGNLVDDALAIMDAGVRGCGKGFAKGSVNGLASFQRINFR